MGKDTIKKIIRLFLIGVGAIALVSELFSKTKNYYIQILGLVLLMIGLFWVNTKITSKTKEQDTTVLEEEE